MIFSPDWGTPEGDRRTKATITAMLIVVVVALFVVLPIAAWFSR